MMKIEIEDITNLDAAAKGWRFSRNLDASVGWDSVVGVDVPVNELPSAILSMSGMTILEREIFASPRNHVMWARTSHVDDPLEFTTPDFQSRDLRQYFAECRARMKRGKAAGLDQDEWRVHLPLASETAWTTRISFRDLIKMIKYIMYLSLRDDIHFSLTYRLADLANKLKEVAQAFFPFPSTSTSISQYLGGTLDTYSMTKYLHEGDVIRRGSMTETEGLYLLSFTVPLWLRAQIVRHRNLTFVDDFFQKVLSSDDVLFKDIGEPINMDIAVTKDVWRSIMSKRSCWIAQDTLSGKKDAWQDLIDQFGWTPSMLPCADGICHYHKDASLRLTPDDPGVPCPRFMNINKIDKEPYRERIEASLASRHPYWREEL